MIEASLAERIDGGSVALDTIEAVLVSVDGRTELEHYRNGRSPTAVVDTWSVTKSVTSALIGIAIGDGVLEGLDQTLAELLPRHRSSMSTELAGVTLRQLMDMSAGFGDERFNPLLGEQMFEHEGDTVSFVLRRGLENPPGERFGYSNGAAHLVTAVLAAGLQREDGDSPRSVLDYAREKLFGPLGIDTSGASSARFAPSDNSGSDRTGFGWDTDARGLHSGCCLLRMRPADMLRIGELFLADGVWQGRRILPAGWVATSTAASETNPSYGLMWWLGASPAGGVAYAARGSGGQLILVSPEDRLVIVVGSKPTKELEINDEDAYALVSQVILPAFA